MRPVVIAPAIDESRDLIQWNRWAPTAALRCTWMPIAADSPFPSPSARGHPLAHEPERTAHDMPPLNQNAWRSDCERAGRDAASSKAASAEVACNQLLRTGVSAPGPFQMSRLCDPGAKP